MSKHVLTPGNNWEMYSTSRTRFPCHDSWQNGANCLPVDIVIIQSRYGDFFSNLISVELRWSDNREIELEYNKTVTMNVIIISYY